MSLDVTPFQPGTVQFVGAGPGAADLLPVRSVQLLQQADVVLHDALGTDDVLRAWCRGSRWIAVGKRAGGTSTEQSFINRTLVTEALAGLRVVRLKGGDPVIFGRLDEETGACRAAGIEYTVVPGITAASAAAAQAGISLTRRGQARSLTIVTPAVQRNDPANPAWTRACPPGGTCAVYMAGKKLASSARQLILAGHGPDTPVLVAHGVSTPAQQTIQSSLGQLALGLPASATNEAPCLLLVGQVTADISTISPPLGCQDGASMHAAAHDTIASRISSDSVSVGEVSN